jgi:hypothetical protein
MSSNILALTTIGLGVLTHYLDFYLKIPRGQGLSSGLMLSGATLLNLWRQRGDRSEREDNRIAITLIIAAVLSSYADHAIKIPPPESIANSLLFSGGVLLNIQNFLKRQEPS